MKNIKITFNDQQVMILNRFINDGLANCLESLVKFALSEAQPGKQGKPQVPPRPLHLNLQNEK